MVEKGEEYWMSNSVLADKHACGGPLDVVNFTKDIKDNSMLKSRDKIETEHLNKMPKKLSSE